MQNKGEYTIHFLAVKTDLKTTITIILTILVTLLAVYCYNKLTSSPFEGGFEYPIENKEDEKAKVRDALLKSKNYFTDKEIEELLEIGDVSNVDSNLNIGPKVKTSFE
ncbi:hypothetical protein N9B82_06790 [Saprospiraceae bacterium]|nr:hypothetical protein [Saprospiraceae bacterium]